VLVGDQLPIPGVDCYAWATMKLRLFALFTALSLGVGCGGSAPLLTGSSATGSNFCHSMVDELVAATTRCHVGPDPDPYWRDFYTGSVLCDQVDELLAAGTLTYDRASGADCLKHLSQLDCDYDSSIESCTNAIAGRLPAGNPCSYFGIWRSDCAPGNYCSYTGDACGGICKPYVQPGGSCAYTVPSGFASCVSGSSCRKNELCVSDVGEGQPCMGLSDGHCGDDLSCAWDTDRCTKKQTSGTCAMGVECAAGYVCAGPAGATTCAKAKSPGDSCTQGQSECYGLSFCGDDGKCAHTGVAENQPCGTNSQGEYIQCGTDLYCAVIMSSSGAVIVGGTCQKKKSPGSNCTYTTECSGKSAYCDSTTYLCATCDSSAATGGTTGMGGAGGSASGMGDGGAGGVPSTGGSIGTSAGGTAGSGNAGSGGSSSVNTAGTSGTLPLAAACPTPNTLRIMDFTYAAVDAGGAAAPTEATFGDFKTTFSGGTYIYPDSASALPPALTSDITHSNWHISGTVGTYSGFGLYWNACALLDASAFKGISMIISGNIPANTLYMSVDTAEDEVATAWYVANKITPANAGAFGTCVPISNQYDGTCTTPSKVIPVTATPTTVAILWADLTGGKPQASVTPDKLTSISFYFSYSFGTAPYPVDITIDDLSFVP
jgi:hypothetical protein